MFFQQIQNQVSFLLNNNVFEILFAIHTCELFLNIKVHPFFAQLQIVRVL